MATDTSMAVDSGEIASFDIWLDNYNENKKKKGGKKMTKAERAALKAAFEAEEKMRLELEERERLERERLEMEERAARETLERERRDVDLPRLNAIYAAAEKKSLEIRERRDEKRVWSRYMRSEGSPDPTILADINTFLIVNRTPQEKLDVNQMRDDVVLILSLIEELELILSDKSSCFMPQKTIDEWMQTKESLQSLLQYQLDCFTHRLLRESTAEADKETGNTLSSLSGDVLALACWANLSCNPRLNTQTFSGDSTGVLFKIPPALTKIRCGVRFLRTTYDHLSPTSPTSLLRIKTPIMEKEVLVDGMLGEPHASMRTSAITAATTLTMETTVTITTPPPPPSPPPSPAALAIEAANSDLSLPDVIHEEFEEFRYINDVVDLREMDLVGGVFHFDLVEIPPQPKNVREWTIVELEDPPIKRLTYGREAPEKSKSLLEPAQSGDHHVVVGDVNMNSERSRTSTAASRSAKSQARHSTKRKTGEHGDDKNQTSNQEHGKLTIRGKSQATVNTQATVQSLADVLPPFELSFSLPADCVYYAAPTVGLWDENEKVWRKDQFESVSYDEVTRTITLSTYKFGPLGCFQDRHVNFPFTGWELRPLSNSSASLTINAAFVTVRIEIQGDKCCVREPSECAPLKEVLGEWVTPETLIHILRSRGINIFPYADSRKYVANTFKKKWMQENKRDLWGLFLFPEEFDIPDEPEPEPEDDFLSFLKKPAAEEPEPEPEPPKKGKKGKNKTKNKNVEKSVNPNEASDADGGDDNTETELHTDQGILIVVSKSSVNLNRSSKRSKLSMSSSKKRSGGGRRTKNKPKPKLPQQVLWDGFNEWLTHYRVKHPTIISDLHREMALVAHVLAFSASKWNSEAGESRLIVRAAEAKPGEQVAESNWENFLVCRRRVMPLKLKDEDELFSENLKDGALVMSNFYHMAKDIGSESLQRRIDTVDFAFIETLNEILDATQLLVFS